MGFIKSFKQALEGDEGDMFTAAGIDVGCSHCGKSKFMLTESQLNTRGLTFLDLDWANKRSYGLICVSCGHIEFFINEPEVKEEQR